MIILKQIIEESKIYEGLIVTHSADKTIEMMSNWFSCDDEKGHNHCEFIKSPNNIIKFKTDIINGNELKMLLKLMNNLGWYPSYFVVGVERHKFDKEYYLKCVNEKSFPVLFFEAKYNLELSVEDLQDKMYHLTPRRLSNKIQQIGLAPKSKEKIARHSERIYLANSWEGIEYLLQNSKKFYPTDEEFVVLGIDMKRLMEKRKIRVFEDPIFSGYGVYIYENIPPEFITVEKEVRR
jgi:hypothetical protein